MSFAVLRHGFERAVPAQIIPDRRAGTWFREDFLNPGTVGFSTAGTGSNLGPGEDAGHDGVMVPSVTALNDAAVWIAGGALTTSFGHGAMSYECELQIPVLSNGAQNLTMRIGWGDNGGGAAADQNNGIYFECDFANHGNSNNWFACTAKASVRTKTTTGTPPIAGTYARMRIEVDAGSTLATFKINDVILATVATNLPIVAVAPFYQLVKQLGATNLTARVDYVETYDIYSVQR